MQIETQHLASDIDFKSVRVDGAFEGYISTFGTVDQGGDIVEKGAFDATLAEHMAKGTMPKMLWQHDPTRPCGVWDTMSIDDKGLKGRGRFLLDTQLGKETYILAKNRAIDGISIGYKTIDADREASGLRRLKAVKLMEASVVTFPMNVESVITGVKNLNSIRDVERVLRDAGVPNAFAKLVASHGYEEAKSILERDQRDAEELKDFNEGAEGFLKAIRDMKEKFNVG